MVPSHGHHLHSEVRGLADAAWDDSEPRQPSPPPPVIAETSSQSSVPEPEPEIRPEQGEDNDEDWGLMMTIRWFLRLARERSEGQHIFRIS